MEPLKNKKHQAFVEAFFENNLNATKAYAKVYGVDDKTAGVNGHKLLKNTKIQVRIAEIQAISANKLLITREELLQDLVDIKNLNKSEFAPSALKAIEIINKMCGFNEPERIEHSGVIKLGIPGVTNNDMKELESGE
jgi:phage terminase small subunit